MAISCFSDPEAAGAFNSTWKTNPPVQLTQMSSRLIDSQLCSPSFRQTNQEAIRGFGEMAQNNSLFLHCRWTQSEREHDCNFHHSRHSRLSTEKIADDRIGSI
jgi:hypothetical protein